MLLVPSRALVLFGLLFAVAAGCGTTRWTDSARTATEQLLISDAVDQAIAQLDLSALSGQDVYFDPQYLKGTVDENYVVSTLRQHLLASGCTLREKREDAMFVVEARSGAVGTDRNDVMLGVPSVNVPGFVPGAVALPSSIPEIPLAKNTQQRGVAKIAVFAYNRETGKPVWQSGVAPVTSFAKDSWVLGAGPFRKSSVDPKTKFAGDALPLVEARGEAVAAGERRAVPLTAEAFFPDGMTPKPPVAPAAGVAATAPEIPPPAAPPTAPPPAPVAAPAPAANTAAAPPISRPALPGPNLARPASDPAAVQNTPPGPPQREAAARPGHLPTQLAAQGGD